MTTSVKAIFDGPKEPALLNWNAANLLDAQSLQYGDRIAVTSLHQDVSLSYNQLRQRVRRLAARLLENGTKPGDRVVLLAGNCIEFIEIFFATAAIGAISVLVTNTFSVDEFLEALKHVEPQSIFIADRIGFRSNADILGQAVKQFNGPIVVIKKDPTALVDGNMISFDTFSSGSPRGTETSEAVLDSRLETTWTQANPQDPCCFQFTSGTTGARKASMLSHSNLINNASSVGHQLQLSPCDVLCCCPPLSHCFGLVCGLLASVVHGAKLVIPSDIFNPALSVQALGEENCTILHAVPSMFEALLKQERKRQRQKNASPIEYKLRSGIIAGATPPRDLLTAIKQTFGLGNLLYPFGMTELSAVCLCTSIDHPLIEDNSSVGTALPHTSVKVIDGQGEAVPVGDPGELCVSGYLVHRGYFRNEAKTSEALLVDHSGRSWLRTGDIVSLDQQGRCKVVGRSKDMIKKHGENIAPSDIEELLVAHTSVNKASVVGIPDARYGESVVAFIETHDRGAVDAQGLKRWLRDQKLLPHKMPDHFVAIGDIQGALHEIPINTSGKVLKTELRTFARQVLATANA